MPDLLATDPGRRVLVLEYLTSHKPPAAGWMSAYATALARLHAATRPDDAGVLPAWSGPTPADLPAGFPTCWCATSVPGPTCSQAEADYHDTWRSLTGTSPSGHLADACAGWLIRGDALVQRAHRGQPGYLTQLPHKDWSWGTATARQRLLHRLTAVTTRAAHHPLRAGRR